MVADYINGAFELIGGLAVWQNVRRIRRDKQIRGVDWKVSAFFWSWGVWNLYYYPSLSQWASFLGGLFIVSGNFAWVAYALRYRKQ